MTQICTDLECSLKSRLSYIYAALIQHKAWLAKSKSPIFALDGMDAVVKKFYCSFYKVKTTRYKNCMDAIFISGECAPP